MAETSNDTAALAQRYWSMWADALRDGGAGFGFDVGKQGLGDALGTWVRQAGPQNGFGGLLERFQSQYRDWYGQMQQVAAQFAGRNHHARDVTEAWRAAFAGGHPFAGLLQGMQGPGLENLVQWSEASAPWLDGLRTQALSALGLPAFGVAREHQERLQALGKAQLRMQDAQRGFNALLAKVSQAAFSRFESRLAEREEPGRQIGSVRALFDLWVDAAEDAWAEAALSEEYRHTFGELANAQMRLRGAAQAISEKMMEASGLPARSELDGAYRKIAELERRLRGVVAASETAAGSAAAAPAPARASPAPARSDPAPKRAADKQAKAAKPKSAKPAQATKARKPTAVRTAKQPVKRGKPAARKR